MQSYNFIKIHVFRFNQGKNQKYSIGINFCMLNNKRIEYVPSCNKKGTPTQQLLSRLEIVLLRAM